MLLIDKETSYRLREVLYTTSDDIRKFEPLGEGGPSSLVQIIDTFDPAVFTVRYMEPLGSKAPVESRFLKPIISKALVIVNDVATGVNYVALLARSEDYPINKKVQFLLGKQYLMGGGSSKRTIKKHRYRRRNGNIRVIKNNNKKKNKRTNKKERVYKSNKKQRTNKKKKVKSKQITNKRRTNKKKRTNRK